MPFLFSHVCDLLEQLRRTQQHQRPSQEGRLADHGLIQAWFLQHKHFVRSDSVDLAALLSTLLPEKRTDRVFEIKENKLHKLVVKTLGLGHGRAMMMERWKNPGTGVDLADCVAHVIQETPNPRGNVPVTVEEVDQLLHNVASWRRFSSPEVRASSAIGGGHGRSQDDVAALASLYKVLSAREAKWFTRLILKSYKPVLVPENFVYDSLHPLLRQILLVHDKYAVACVKLKKVFDGLVDERWLIHHLKPVLGTPVGRQKWEKGRDPKHCTTMARGRVVSCEQKVDGEYCQIHVDLSKGRDCIQIFSKSRKDSTRDRIGLHQAIRDSLRLGKANCPLQTGCILEGELVVYSDEDKKILDFYKIRNHVTRSGCKIGAGDDAWPLPGEHLMIVYFDVLLLDDASLLHAVQSERFRILESLVTILEGRAALVRREVIDFGSDAAARDVARVFGRCIASNEEGLVLKPDEPYFSTSMHPYSNCTIKYKKQYSYGYGDVGDFAVVGARYDAAAAKGLDIRHLKWTHFYIACIRNKEEVARWDVAPDYKVLGVVELNKTQLDLFRRCVSPEWREVTMEKPATFDIELGVDDGKRPSIVFLRPPVFDVRCFSFDRRGDKGDWTPRHPVVTKIHFGRTYGDVLSWDEVQKLAARARADADAQLAGYLGAGSGSVSAGSVREDNLADSQWSEQTNSVITVSTESQQSSFNSLSLHEEQQPSSTRIETDGSNSKATNTSPVQDSAGLSSSHKRRASSPCTNPRPPRTRTCATATHALVPKPSELVASTAPAPRRAISYSAPAGPACTLAGFSILLSPCAAAVPCLTQDLLPRHGITALYGDPEAWASQPSPARRLVLVDGRGRETTDFLTRAEAAGKPRRELARRGGVLAEWVPVFDWRVIEAVAWEPFDERSRRWRKWWVGFV